MKKLISIFLAAVVMVNALSIAVFAEMDNTWHYVVAGYYDEHDNFIPRDEDEVQLDYAKLEAVSLKYLSGLLDNDNLTDAQKALIVHDRIIENCEYDLTYTKRYATHTLLEGSSVCTGYSYAYKYLLEKLGIKCTFETSEVLNHLWNIVYLDGKKYYVDLTYDDPSYDMSGRVSHKNFLISSQRFLETHAGGLSPLNSTNVDFDMTINNTEYQDLFWTNSDTAFQLIGNNIYYIDNTNSKLMKVGSSTPLASLSIDWMISKTSYYPGNFSKLASDGYNLYYSDYKSIYKFDVSTNTSTEVYKLDGTFDKYDNIYGFTFNECQLIFEACHDLDWNENTKNSIQKTVAVDHYYKTLWHTDVNNHWQECLVCGNKKNITAHNFLAGYHHDKTNHWYECSVCGVKKDIQEHIYDHNCDSSCNLCGYLRTAPHYPNDDWYSNNEQHWRMCYNCSKQYAVENHNWDAGTLVEQATCTSQGVGKYKCLDCGKEKYEYFQTKLHTEVIHPAVAATCTKDGKTEGKHCSVCNTVIVAQTVIPASGHKVVTDSKVEATCTQAGLTEGSHCSTCGYVFVSQSVVPAKGHSYNLSWSSDINSHWHECAVCGERKDIVTHTWNSGVETIHPTCAKEGNIRYTCTVCNRLKDEDIAKTPHQLESISGYSATCTASGMTDGRKCKVCNEIIEPQQIIPPKGHNLMAGWLSNEDKHWQKCSTCMVDTNVQNHLYDNSCDTTCNVCGAIRTITHKYNTFYTKDATHHWFECFVCGDKIDIDNHIFDNSCDTTCNVCEYERAVSHTWDGGKITTKASTTANGQKTYTCTTCNSKKTEAIAYPKTITLSTTTYAYSGAVRKPSVTVKDSKGKVISSANYSVTYASGRKYVNKYAVTVKFKGNLYKGTVTKYFTIVPKNTTNLKVTLPKKAQIKVTWKKYTTQTTGYQIQYSTSKTFKSGNKTVTITSNKTTAKTIGSLKSKKYYYVRIRTYKTVGKTKYYSSWSGTKTVKTK